MRTVTYNGDSTAVVIGNVGTFPRGVPVEFPDELGPDDVGLTDGELLELGLSFDPDVWTIKPPFPAAAPPVDDAGESDAEPAGEPATASADNDTASPAKPARKRS